MDVLNHVVLGATTDYVSFVQSIPQLADAPTAILTAFLLGLMRMAPIVSIVPFLGGKLPGPAKMGFALCLITIFLPHIVMTSRIEVGYNMAFTAYALKELLVGFILAFLASIPFHIASSSGALIDFLRGSSSLQVTDPTMQTQTSPIGTLYNQVLIVLFFQVGGPFLFFDAILDSYHYIPIDKMLPASFFNLKLSFWEMIMGLLTKVTALAIQFAAPSILAILMAEMFLGIANRLAVNVQIAFLGMALKSILGLGLLWAGWFFILQQMLKSTLLWFHEFVKTLSSL
jgi:type III secretion protein T